MKAIQNLIRIYLDKFSMEIWTLLLVVDWVNIDNVSYENFFSRFKNYMKLAWNMPI